MQVRPISAVICPLDQKPLATVGTSLRCEAGHTFDRAREGYTNLLAVQWKGSKNPGDDAAMVAARVRFLGAGFYLPIVELVFAHLGAGAGAVADAGCGEGYYLRTIAELAAAAADASRPLELGGYDISKDAVRAAAKQRGPIAYFVAGHRHPPFAPASLDAVLSLFGFPDWPSFAGMLKPGGAVLAVDPGPDHLIELRRIIYPEVNPAKEARNEEAAAAGLTLAAETPLRFSFEVPSAALLADLLSMTPHGHRASPARKQALLDRGGLALTGDVVLRRWVKG